MKAKKVKPYIESPEDAERFNREVDYAAPNFVISSPKGWLGKRKGVVRDFIFREWAGVEWKDLVEVKVHPGKIGGSWRAPKKRTRTGRTWRIGVRCPRDKYPHNRHVSVGSVPTDPVAGALIGMKFVNQITKVDFADREEALIFVFAWLLHRVLRKNYRDKPLVEGRATWGFASRYAVAILEKFRAGRGAKT